MDEKTLAVQRMQDYIQIHFDSEITLASLAEHARFSPWYAHRLFTELTGVTPADYIRKLRLTQAAKKLKNQKCMITDLAFDLGFESLDGFTRAFVREFGVTPKQYKTRPVPIPLFIPYGVKFKDSMKEKNIMGDSKNIKTDCKKNSTAVKSIFIQVIQKPERKVIIKRGVKATEYWAYCNEVGCDVWGILSSMDSLCGEPVCLWLTDDYIKPGTSKYVQGVEVASDFEGTVPVGFDIITLPSAEYLMFQGEPFAEEDYLEAIANVQNAMNNYDPSIIGYKWDTKNPRIQLEPRGERGYIELMAVERK